MGELMLFLLMYLLLGTIVVALAAGLWQERLATRRDARAQQRRAGLCLGCGYDLRGSRDGCPECGRPGRTRARDLDEHEA